MYLSCRTSILLLKQTEGLKSCVRYILTIKYMLTLVSGKPISKDKVNRSLDLCLIAKETTGDCKHGFVFKHVYTFHSQSL